METVAPGLDLLTSRPNYAFNVYLVDDVIADAATRWARGRILAELRTRPVRAHFVSHAHSDHQGSSHAIHERLGVPVWAPAGAADAIASGDLREHTADHPITRLQRRLWAGPGVPVARRLREGDEVGRFTVLETPGHAPALASLWRESDRVLIAFDVLFGRHPINGRPGLHEPPVAFTSDPGLNRTQIRRLAALEPSIVCFGHGPPLRDAAARLRRFAAALAV